MLIANSRRKSAHSLEPVQLSPLGGVIREVAGLFIGVAFGLDVWLILILATALAYLSEFSLGVVALKQVKIGKK